ncbi:MAG: twin-arginine translocase TatA/TatE family subunit [Nitrospira sp.]|jgi:TatA/E family protein of Tat protein translocase|nr:twin-arginine translocase TatA/TatE family subunit [Nitrospira sp.]
MFGTMGISELIIILVIVLIIFGAGRLPQIGEGVGKALKGFKKEVNEMPPPPDAAQVQPEAVAPQVVQAQAAPVVAPPAAQAPAAPKATNVPYVPGPELTPGTTASMLYNMGPQSPQAPRSAAPQPAATSPGAAQRVVTMEERAAAPAPMSRAQYPPLPPGAQAKPAANRPSAIVNKDAVARVQAQQAALKAKAAQPAGVSPNDMQSLGEGLGDALRTFRQAVADVRNTVDPEMRTIQNEMDSAQKEFQQSLEAARELPVVDEEPPKPA